MEYKYDITVSFAGEDRHIVEPIALELSKKGIKIFYDKLEQADLWGKDLYQHLSEVYSSHAKYCIIFISTSYLEKSWTKHELRSAQSRAFKENSEYILPIKLDDSVVVGIPNTIGYLDARTMSSDMIIEMILKKLNIEIDKYNNMLFWKIRSVINAFDPMDLLSVGKEIAFNPPSDEYNPEIEEIYDVLPLVNSVDELYEKIIRVFSKYFGDTEIYDERIYGAISNEIWALKDDNNFSELYGYTKHSE